MIRNQKITAECSVCHRQITSPAEELSHNIRRNKDKRIWMCRECAFQGKDPAGILWPEYKKRELMQ